MSPPVAALARSCFSALGTSAVVVTEEDALDVATEVVAAEVADVDVACSRFRDDSGLSAVNQGAGRPVVVSGTLLDAVDVALGGGGRDGRSRRSDDRACPAGARLRP